jgi:hypothetical protein
VHKLVVAFAFVLSAVFVSGCNNKKQADAKESERLMRIVKHGLKDPFTAVFEDVRLVEFEERSDRDRPPVSKSALCGMVNAKNAMGAWTGFEKFIAFGHEVRFESSFESRELFAYLAGEIGSLQGGNWPQLAGLHVEASRTLGRSLRQPKTGDSRSRSR